MDTDEEFDGEDFSEEEEEDTDVESLDDIEEIAEFDDGEDEDLGLKDDLEEDEEAADADEEIEEEALEEDEEDEDEEDEEEALDALLTRGKDLDGEYLRLDDEDSAEDLAVVTAPVAVEEFTCRSCFLVKRRAQLADEKKLICLDCA